MVILNSTGALSYTSLYNVVNYPAGTLPVTTVTSSDVAKTMSSTFYKAETNIEKLIQEVNKPMDIFYSTLSWCIPKEQIYIHIYKQNFKIKVFWINYCADN